MSLDLKRDREVRFQRSGGREFQSWGAEHLKALLPVVLRQAEGTVRWVEGEDLREWLWSGDVEKVRQIWRGKVVDGFDSIQKDF